MTGAAASLEEGWAALFGGRWEQARERFEQVLEEQDGEPAALDGLGQALWWVGDTEAAMRLRERAFAEYRRRGDSAAAANVAAYLAGEYRIAGNASLAGGWLGRATRLLEGCGDCEGLAWVEIEQAKRAGEPEAAERHARAALEVAERIDDVALQAAAGSHLGLARIAQGDVDGGLALLDEAMAMAMGAEAEDPLTIGDACCTTLVACDRLADPERARDWGRAITEFVRAHNYLPLTSWCRAVYAGFLITTGKWAEAETELTEALDEADRIVNAKRTAALAKLAELRLLQGRVEEAGRLLAGIEDRPAAVVASVRLHLARGEQELAEQRLDRQLEKSGQPAALHELRAQVALAKGDAVAAGEAIAALREAAGGAGRADLLALASVHDAAATRAGGDAVDPAPLEAAIEELVELAMPFEEATARLELARALRASHAALAVEQARSALGIFDGLGAAPGADAAAALLRELGAPGRPAPRSGEVLSKRESEVLALLADGLSNGEIAERLVISPRTAEHHVASILRKLELRSRAEATAYAIRQSG